METKQTCYKCGQVKTALRNEESDGEIQMAFVTYGKHKGQYRCMDCKKNPNEMTEMQRNALIEKAKVFYANEGYTQAGFESLLERWKNEGKLDKSLLALEEFYLPKTDGKKSKINGLSSDEERLSWCEQYIKILLSFKDESMEMHRLDGKEISELKKRISKLEGGED